MSLWFDMCCSTLKARERQFSASRMAYSISTAIVPGTRIALLGQLVAANYRDAYVGSYSDTLSVLILP